MQATRARIIRCLSAVDVAMSTTCSQWWAQGPTLTGSPCSPYQVRAASSASLHPHYGTLFRAWSSREPRDQSDLAIACRPPGTFTVSRRQCVCSRITSPTTSESNTSTWDRAAGISQKQSHSQPPNQQAICLRGMLSSMAQCVCVQLRWNAKRDLKA